MQEFGFSAPGRCGIVGNPSDIYGGFVVSCSIPLRNTCRLALGAPEQASEVLWQAATGRFPLEDWGYQWSSEVPRSSGLAGSTALLAAALAAVLTVREEAPDLDSTDGKTAFAELVRDVELNEAGVICGFQDAYMAVYGGLNALDYAGKHPIEPGPPGRVESFQAELPFLLITTGVERLSGSVHGPMRERWLRGEGDVVQAMEAIAEAGRIGHRALIAGDWDTLAEAMADNHARIAQLGGSGEAIDRLVEACLRHGARAAKLAGAGMGGTVIALADDPDELQKGLAGEGYARFLRPEIAEGLRAEAPNPTSEE